MEILSLEAQGALLFFVAAGLGNQLGKWALGSAWRKLALFRRIGVGWILATLLFAALGALPILLGEKLAAVLTYGVLLAGLALGIRRVFTHQHPPWEKYFLLVLIALGAVLVGLFYFSPVPGPLEAYYGDLPAYYRMAANIRRARPEWMDYWVGDYPRGVYIVPIQYPVLTFLTAGFQQVFQRSWAFTSIYAVISGLLGMYYAISLVFEKLKKRPTLLGCLALLAIFLVPAGVMFHLALGGLTVSLFAFFLILLDFLTPSVKFSPPRLILFLLCTSVCIALTRPEGALFLACLFPLIALNYLIPKAWDRSHALTAGTLVALAVSLFWVVPFVVGKVVGKAPSIYYLHFDTPYGKIGQGKKDNLGWSSVNHDNVRENLGMPRLHTELNSKFWEEAYRHRGRLWDYAVLNIMENFQPRNVYFLLCLAVPTFFVGTGVMRVAWLAFLIFAPVLYAININASLRHIWPIFLVLMTFGYFSVLKILFRWGRLPYLSIQGRQIILGAAVVVAALSVGSDIRETALLRQRAGNFREAHLFALAQPFLKPDSKVASNYPQLASLMLDRPSVGCSNLGYMVEEIVDHFSPDLVLLRKNSPWDYWYEPALLTKMRRKHYEPVLGSLKVPFVIFRKKSGEKIPQEKVHGTPRVDG